MGGGNAPVSSAAGRLARGLDGLLHLLAAVLLFLMMMLTFIDVIGRYVFSSPLPGAFEITELAMGILIFAGLPLISARDGHVSVNILDGLLGARVIQARAVAMDLLMAGCLAVLGWVLWHKAGQLAGYGDATAYLHLPIAPVVFGMAALSAVTALIMLAKFGRGGLALLRGEG